MRSVRRPRRRLAHEGLAEGHHHRPLRRCVAEILQRAGDAADRSVMRNEIGLGALGRVRTKTAVPPRLVSTVNDVDHRRCGVEGRRPRRRFQFLFGGFFLQ